jgi:hypothetical protein
MAQTGDGDPYLVVRRRAFELAQEGDGASDSDPGGGFGDALEQVCFDPRLGRRELLVAHVLEQVLEDAIVRLAHRVGDRGQRLTPATSTAPPPIAAPATAPAAEREEAALATLEQAARAFLAQQGITAHQLVRRSSFGRVFRIYHLPTGAPAFPLPAHINEKDEVELWTVIPEGAAVAVDVTACDKVPAVRVAGTYKLTKEAVGTLQSGEAPAFRLESYGRRLRCAGALTYKLEVKHGGLTAQTGTSIPFDQVYRFEWGVGFMFDFGRPHKLSLGDRPTAAGTGSEKFVVDHDDYTGVRPVISLGVNLCGTNPEELTWCDRLFTPTLLIDPTKLTSGFGVGVTVRPFHGFGLLAGMTVFKSTVLDDAARVGPGDTWTPAGELPTREVFNEDSLGFVLAAIVSTDVLAALRKSD